MDKDRSNLARFLYTFLFLFVFIIDKRKASVRSFSVILSLL